MSLPIRLLILNDDPRLRTRLRLLLEQAHAIQLVGETANVVDLAPLCSRTSPQILLIRGSEASLIREIALLVGDPPLGPYLIALLDPAETPPLAKLLQAPLHGCCFYSEINENLLHIVCAVAGGVALFSRAVLTHHPPPTLRSLLAKMQVELTGQEEKIVALMAQALSNSEIAQQLGLAEQTVRNTAKTIYDKLGTNKREKIVAWFHAAVFPSQQQ